MIRAAESGALSLEKLEAMTSVCSVGLDMIAIPGDTTAETIAGIIADECAIGVVNAKTTAVRLHSRHRQDAWATGVVRRSARRGAGDAGERVGRLGLRPPRRTLPRATAA